MSTMTHAEPSNEPAYDLADTRLVIFHKQATSARLRFLRFEHGLFAFAPLDAGVEMLEDESARLTPPLVEWHPAVLQRMAEGYIGLAPGSLCMEPEFHGLLPTTKGALRLRALALTTIDPPFEAVERIGGRFISITEARSMSALEREALRGIYEHVIG